MKINLEELRKEIEVNIDNLQEEWKMQPSLFLKYSLRLSKLIHEKDIYRSELANKIAKELENEKLSEAALTRMLDNDKDGICLQLQINYFKNAVQAFEHKKKALEYETQLLIGGFFSEPKEKQPIKKKKGG